MISCWLAKWCQNFWLRSCKPKMNRGGSKANQPREESRKELRNNLHNPILYALWIIIRARKCWRCLLGSVFLLQRSNCRVLNLSDIGVCWYAFWERIACNIVPIIISGVSTDLDIIHQSLDSSLNCGRYGRFLGSGRLGFSYLHPWYSKPQDSHEKRSLLGHKGNIQYVAPCVCGSMHFIP